jgi:6-phosphogluconolactonase (cycloisomerase 2 family)
MQNHFFARKRLARPARLLLALGLAPVLLSACGGDSGDPVGLADHTLYTMTNASADNQVLAFRRADDGTLTLLGAYSTGGKGLGSTEISAATPQDGVDVLASQGSVQLTPDKRSLVVVNAGDNTVTSFRLDRDGIPTKVSVLSSGGLQPNAVAAGNSLVYVSNVGAASNSFASNVSGFRLASDATLTPIAGSTRSLSTADAQPARAAFNPSGSLLAVDELTTNKISVFPVAADGTLGTAVVNASSGNGPFGSSFLSTGQLLVADVMSGAATSYGAAPSGLLTPISSTVTNGQAAVCWTIVSTDEKTLITTNSGSGTLSTYDIGTGATLALRSAVASTLQGPTSGVVDGGASESGDFIYALDGGIGAISVLHLEADGSLRSVQTVTGNGLPALGGEGLAVR